MARKVEVDAPALGFVKGFRMQAVEVKGSFSFETKGETRHGINIQLSDPNAEVIVSGGALAAAALRTPDAFDVEDDGITFHEDEYLMGSGKGQIIVEKMN